MGERLRGVEQVGQPAAATPIPASEATPLIQVRTEYDRLSEDYEALNARAVELEAIVRELAETDPVGKGDHDGPCVNYVGQDPADFCEYDTCHHHIEAAAGRDTAIVNVWQRATEWVAAQP